MAETDFFELPMLVGEQYMLSAILRETRDTILYRGTQRELQREVIVECLRHSAMDVPRKVSIFLETAKAQAQFTEEHISRVLEVTEAKGTWMVARETPTGEPLNMLQSDGRFLSTTDVCSLMLFLCRLCLRMDAEGVASSHFRTEDVFISDHNFKLTNPACAGTRSPSATRSFLAEAAHELSAILDPNSTPARPMSDLLHRFIIRKDDSSLHSATLYAELAKLHTILTVALPGSR